MISCHTLVNAASDSKSHQLNVTVCFETAPRRLCSSEPSDAADLYRPWLTLLGGFFFVFFLWMLSVKLVFSLSKSKSIFALVCLLWGVRTCEHADVKMLERCDTEPDPSSVCTHRDCAETRYHREVTATCDKCSRAWF